MIKVFFSNGDVSRFSVFTSSTSSKLRALLGAMYPNAILSLFGCTYKADKYLESYFKNLDSSEMRAETLVILSAIKCPGDAPQKIIQYLKQCNENCYPAVLIAFDNDPGLYNCWNYSIHISPTEFVGNANPDDIRYSNHDRECIDTLETSDASIVATPLYFSYEYSTYIETAQKPSEIAFLDAPAFPVFRDLFRIEQGVLRPNNIFHCMPVWRKTLHDVAGYFNEYRYGTYADWALWLSALSKNIRAAFHQQALGIYLVEPNSHNRIYPDLNQFAGNIISDYILLSLIHI
mgnify:CR=1 FL=1